MLLILVENIENKLENYSRRHFSCKCYIKRRRSTLVENSWKPAAVNIPVTNILYRRWPCRISMVAHRVSANSERCGYTPTSSKMSSRGAVGAFSLCILFYLSTLCPSGPPWNEGHRPNGSSRDQCLWDPLKQERHKYRFYWYYMCLLH